MSDFHFKRFSLSDDKSSLKVGTDAVLLGAWATIEKATNIMDIGCGCGIIALMVAQRSPANVLGIDIDKDSVEEAKKNAKRSPWNERVDFECISLQDFYQISKNELFDSIVCNPPYFENSLKSPYEKKNISKHNDLLSYEDLAKIVSLLLTQNGCFNVILPLNGYEKFEKICQKAGLFPTKCCLIKPSPTKKTHRIMSCFIRKTSLLSIEYLLIRDEKGVFSSEYKQLTQDYYLKL